MSVVRTDDDGLRLVRLDVTCKACGGLVDVEPAPEHAKGCACALRKKTRAQAMALNKIAQAGSLSPEIIRRINDGTYEP